MTIEKLPDLGAAVFINGCAALNFTYRHSHSKARERTVGTLDYNRLENR